MSRERAAIGLGANLGDPPTQLERALAALGALPHTRLIARSSFYRSAPMGPPQPEYCNAACLLDTGLPAQELVRRCKRIEADCGRDLSAPRWTARMLDLDLLVYGSHVIRQPGLSVPHPGIAERNFVLLPLAEISPDLVIPELGRAGELAARCPREGLQPWGALP